MRSKRNPLCVALDVDSGMDAIELAKSLQQDVGMVKVGLQLFSTSGPQIVAQLRAIGVNVFLDLKLCDIPNTVSRAVSALASLGPQVINVHALGGVRMMRAAKEAAASIDGGPQVIAVTLLTSLDEQALRDELGIHRSVKDQVLLLAARAKSAGLDGVVCSPQEVGLLRAEFGDDFLLVTPGVRPGWTPRNDQLRVSTPKEALDAGADILVIGRPILRADDPVVAARRIRLEL